MVLPFSSSTFLKMLFMLFSVSLICETSLVFADSKLLPSSVFAYSNLLLSSDFATS